MTRSRDEEEPPAPVESNAATSEIACTPSHALDPALRATPLERPSGAAAGELARGDLVGRYVVIERVGAGGMGVVYSAFDPKLDRKIALKLVRGAHPSGASRLLREAQTLARVSHPNVVAVLDVGTFGQQVFLAMEYVDGVTLAEWRKRTAPSWRSVVEVFALAGRGLAAAHRSGVLHRDFKPSNVLVSDDGRVRVVDFGLARAIDAGNDERDQDRHAPERDAMVSLTRTGTVLGTPAYMAPEQVRGRAEPRTDQFSFCVSLYEMLCSELPLDVDHDVWTRRPWPRKRSVPSPLERVLDRGLRLDPDERYPSMDPLLHELGRIASRRRSRGIRVAVALVAAAGLTAALAASTNRAHLCTGGGEQLDGIWDSPRKQAIHDAFVTTGALGATDAYRSLVRALDGWTRSWVAMRQEVCAATRLRGEQSEALLDLRMACLDRRLLELRAFSDVAVKADAAVVQKAVEAAQSLPGLAGCADSRALRAVVPPPNLETRAQVDALHATLAQAAAEQLAGQFATASRRAQAVTTQAEKLGYAPLEAEALLLVSSLENDIGEPKSAQAALVRAVAAAQRGRDDAVAAEAWVKMVFVVGELQGNWSLAEQDGAIARGTLERLDGRWDLHVNLEGHLSALAYRQGKYQDAIRYAETAVQLAREHGLHPSAAVAAQVPRGIALGELGRFDEAIVAEKEALRLIEERYGAFHPKVAACLGDVGRLLAQHGDYPAAIAELQRSIDLYEKLFGPNYFQTAFPLFNRGEVYLAEGKSAKAVADYRRAMELFEAASGRDHPLLAYPLTGLGEAELLTGTPAAAVPLFERALSLREANPGNPVDLARTRFGLARALRSAGRDRERARSLAKAARASYAAAGSRNTHELAAVEAWLLVP